MSCWAVLSSLGRGRCCICGTTSERHSFSSASRRKLPDGTVASTQALASSACESYLSRRVLDPDACWRCVLASRRNARSNDRHWKYDSCRTTIAGTLRSPQTWWTRCTANSEALRPSSSRSRRAGRAISVWWHRDRGRCRRTLSGRLVPYHARWTMRGTGFEHSGVFSAGTECRRYPYMFGKF